MKINVKIQDNTYEVEVGDVHARPITVEVDGEAFEVWPEEVAAPALPQKQASTAPAAAPGKAAAFEQGGSSTAKAGAVIAPIPGTIIEIKVSEGETVAYGQELCVLEAMKMKNSIRANHAAKVVKIHTSTGEQVQQGKLLMELSEKAD